MLNLKLLIFTLFLVSQASCFEYDLRIESDSPIAAGTSVTFNVTLLIDGEVAPRKDYQFRYNFEGVQKSKKSDDPSVLFVVNSEDLSHGHYNVEFAVDEFYIFMYLEKIKKRATFEVTNHFTGLMQLTQGPNSTVRENGYVSNQYETVHNIVISDKDKKLFDKAAYVRVYWFVDCLYIGMTDSLNFSNWYRNENGKYNVEALLMLSYEPLPTPTSSTTPKTTTTTSTTTTTTTTPKTTSTTTTTTTTPKTTTTTTLKTTTTTSTTTTKKPSRRKRETSAPDFQWNAKALLEGGLIKPENVAYENMTESNFIVTTTEMTMDERIKMLQDTGVPYYGVCTNDTKVIMDAKKIYGYYQRTIIVEVPVSNVTVGNNVWLKHGDMCRLQIKFIGTAPFSYCEKVLRNDNTSEVASVDDDDCNDWKKTDEKEISYKHFFAKSSNSYTLILFIKNEVALTRTTIGVQFYEDQSRSQLSVVIVPVVFTLMAVVLIVFGVAYYVQNRNQFLIEVADFNFGETQSVDSLEYKSFLQRLLDSISDLFIRHNYNDDLDSPGGEPSNQNYNIMP